MTNLITALFTENTFFIILDTIYIHKYGEMGSCKEKGHIICYDIVRIAVEHSLKK